MSGRIVITAAAVVSPVGNSLDEVFAALAAATPGIGRIQNFDATDYPSQLGAEVREAGTARRFPSGVDRKERFLEEVLQQVAASASFQAVPGSLRCCAIGDGLDYFDLPGYTESAAAAAGQWQPWSRNSLTMTRELAQRFGIAGEINVNVTACVAASQALGYAFRRLRRLPPGSLFVGGGVDSMLNPLHYMGFHKLGALSDWDGEPKEACRPFDRHRRGLVLGEGAALFALQHEETALPGSILAEIAGYGASMDAHMVTDPDPSGRLLAEAAGKALAEAGLAADEIDCLHLHGTGTRKNDPAEAAAVRLLFPQRYRDIPVFSMKGQMGHLIAGCGAMEMLGVLYSLATQSVPPTVNFGAPDPEVPLRVVGGRPLGMEIRNILKLNAAFGGQNTALVVKRYDP